MSQRSVILGGQVLHGRDRFGSWLVRAVDGWSKTPPVKGEALDRPDTDGEFDLPVRYGARALVITGRVVCRSIQDATAARNRITGLLPSSAVLQVTDAAGGTQWASVKRNGQIAADLTGPLVRFTIEAKAVDPKKYGDANTFTVPSGSSYVTVSHRGNAVGYPVVKVSGDMPGGYVLQSSAGAEYRVSTALTSGSPHTIDMATGLLTRGGVIVAGGVTRADLWRVPGGTTATNLRLQPITTGTGTATMTLLDTFI